MFRVISRGVVIAQFHTRYEAERFAIAIAHRASVAPEIVFHDGEYPEAVDARPGAFKDAA